MALKNFMLLIKDKPITFDPMRWVLVWYCICNTWSPFPQSYRGEARRASQRHFFSHLNSQLPSMSDQKVKKTVHLTSPLSFSPVLSAAWGTFPFGCVCLPMCFSILIFPIASGDLTFHPLIRARTIETFLSFPLPQCQWTNPSRVSSPPSQYFYCTSSAEKHLSVLLKNAPNDFPIFPSSCLPSHTLMECSFQNMNNTTTNNNNNNSILWYYNNSIIEALSHARHCSKYFTYIISYIFLISAFLRYNWYVKLQAI